MVGSGRLIGLILIALAVAGLGGTAIWAFGNESLQSGGRTLTLGCGLLFAVLLAGVGVWFMMQGKTESTQFAQVEKQKRILNMVATQGTVPISSIALEMNMPLDQVKAAIYDLVGKGLFTGYVDWKGGKLVSRDAASLNQSVADGKCPNCGAPQIVAGKGMVKCEYCGAEIFLPQA
jgi:hypothetical protein